MKKGIGKPAKKVQIIARYYFKKNGHVVYAVRSSKGDEQYCTTIINGKATGCTCPAKKPCYHMIQLQEREAARTPKPSRDEQMAAIRKQSEAAVAAIDAEVQAHVATEKAHPAQPKSEQARIADDWRERAMKAPINGDRPFSVLKQAV